MVILTKIEEAKLTSKGQITIPKSIRSHLRLKPGRKVIFVPEGRDVVMMPKTKDSLLGLAKIRSELEKEGKLFTEKEIKQMMKESKKEWSKIE